MIVQSHQFPNRIGKPVTCLCDLIVESTDRALVEFCLRSSNIVLGVYITYLIPYNEFFEMLPAPKLREPL